MEDLEYARQQWLLDEPKFRAFGDYLKICLDEVMRSAGLSGYLSVHVDITLLASDPHSKEFPASEFRAELQVRTLAQNLWSEMAHNTSYKSDNVVDGKLRRRLHLLAGLIEVADNEYQRVEDELARLPELPEVAILRALEREFHRFSNRPGDTELSLRVIRLLWPLYGSTPQEISSRFAKLVGENKDMFAQVFGEAELSAAGRSAFMFQPEVLMIYDQLDAMPYRLLPKWAQEFPEKELERIALRFGFSPLV